jgi:hypothetical protein
MVHDKWPKMYGDIYRVYIAAGPGAFVSSPEHIEVRLLILFMFPCLTN